MPRSPLMKNVHGIKLMLTQRNWYCSTALLLAAFNWSGLSSCWSKVFHTDPNPSCGEDQNLLLAKMTGHSVNNTTPWMIKRLYSTSAAKPSLASVSSLTVATSPVASSNTRTVHYKNVSPQAVDQIVSSDGPHYLRINMAIVEMKRNVPVPKSGAVNRS